MSTTQRALAEWPTCVSLVSCYALWALSLAIAGPAFGLPIWLGLAAGITLASVAIAFHASLTHEVIHGHPTRSPWLNATLVWPTLGLLIPYARFRDIHLAHHQDATLTDPYDDPESNYLDPAVWARLPRWVQCVLRANNTLLGRVLLGPLIGQIAFMRGDVQAIRAGDQAVRDAWLLHIAPVALVLALVALSPLPLWAYLVAVYLGNGLVRIRTFLEHQAHEHTGGRTVVIEDRGPLSLLFLNNNFHIVHHMHPRVPWYELPGLYAENRARYLRRNHGYRYLSYSEVIGAHLLRAKDTVPHPLWPQPDGAEDAIRTPPAAPMAPMVGAVPAPVVRRP